MVESGDRAQKERVESVGYQVHSASSDSISANIVQSPGHGQEGISEKVRRA